MNNIAEDGQVKPLVQAIPARVILQVGDIFSFGGEKYYRDKWVKEPTTIDARLGSAQRHILKYQAGTPLDDESGMSHLTHAITQLMMAQEYINMGIGDE